MEVQKQTPRWTDIFANQNAKVGTEASLPTNHLPEQPVSVFQREEVVGRGSRREESKHDGAAVVCAHHPHICLYCWMTEAMAHIVEVRTFDSALADISAFTNV